MAVDIAEFVTLDETQIKAVAQASQEKAAAFQSVREVLSATFADQKRIGVDTLLAFMDERVAEYTAASDPGYWVKS
jgi:hypothetical protein